MLDKTKIIILPTITCLMMWPTEAVAQVKYKILFLNTTSVVVDGRRLHVGDTLLDNQKIHWEQERQAMKVADLQTRRQRVLVADKQMLKGHHSLSEMLSATHSLSSRDGRPTNVHQLREALTGQQVLTDTLWQEMTLAVDDTHYFFLSYQYRGETIYKLLPRRSGWFVIDRSIFTIDGESIEPFSTPLRIYYQNGDVRELVTDECYLQVVPLFLKL